MTIFADHQYSFWEIVMMLMLTALASGTLVSIVYTVADDWDVWKEIVRDATITAMVGAYGLFCFTIGIALASVLWILR